MYYIYIHACLLLGTHGLTTNDDYELSLLRGCGKDS